MSMLNMWALLFMHIGSKWISFRHASGNTDGEQRLMLMGLLLWQNVLQNNNIYVYEAANGSHLYMVVVTVMENKAVCQWS